jgi:hypothetical protein
MAMKLRKLSFSLVVLMALLVTGRAHAQNCYNLAYRYCCQHHPYWSIPCEVAEGGICEGEVLDSVNDFGQVLIPPTSGAMTAASFQYTGDLQCKMKRPHCNPLSDPVCTVLPTEWVLWCASHERKTIWQFCEGF